MKGDTTVYLRMENRDLVNLLCKDTSVASWNQALNYPSLCYDIFPFANVKKITSSSHTG